MTGGWEFKAVQRHPSGNWSLSPINREQQSKVHMYVKALEVAGQSQVPDPKFSRYFCRESVGYRAMHQGGNVEYGLCQALHGEESLVAVFRSSMSESQEIGQVPIMGIIADDFEGDKPASPCGNCRDIMLDAFDPDLEIVSGPTNGGQAVVAKLSDYLFNDYRPEDFLREEWLDCFKGTILDAFYWGNRYAYDGYSPSDIHPERRYYSCIMGRSCSHVGALDLMCDYHPIYPLRDAIRQARRVGDPHFGPVFIVGQDTSGELADIPPHVMYKDRQHLMEFNLGQELLDGKEFDPSVTLIRLKQTPSGTEINRTWQTSVKEWLPFPFSPRNFGSEFVSGFTQYLKSRI